VGTFCEIVKSLHVPSKRQRVTNITGGDSIASSSSSSLVAVPKEEEEEANGKMWGNFLKQHLSHLDKYIEEIPGGDRNYNQQLVMIDIFI
jgi:hypothetical protein